MNLRQQHKKQFLSRVKQSTRDSNAIQVFVACHLSRVKNIYIYRYFVCRGCSIQSSLGDLTRGVDYRRACQVPTHSD